MLGEVIALFFKGCNRLRCTTCRGRLYIFYSQRRRPGMLSDKEMWHSRQFYSFALYKVRDNQRAPHESMRSDHLNYLDARSGERRKTFMMMDDC